MSFGGALADESAEVGGGGLEQNIGGLEVPVHDAQFVQVAHARRNVQQRVQHRPLRQAKGGKGDEELVSGL